MLRDPKFPDIFRRRFKPGKQCLVTVVVEPHRHGIAANPPLEHGLDCRHLTEEIQTGPVIAHFAIESRGQIEPSPHWPARRGGINYQMPFFLQRLKHLMN